MQLTAMSEIAFVNQEPIPMIFMLRPRSGAGQWVKAESYAAMPDFDVREYVDIYGNLCQRILAPEGNFRFSARAVVRVADEIDLAPGLAPTPVNSLPDTTLVYLLASRYCQSDLLGGLAEQITREVCPGYDQVEAVRCWIHTNVAYQ